MIRSMLYRIAVVSMLLLFCVNPGGVTVAAPDGPTQVESMDGLHQPPVVLRADPNVSIQRVPAPAYMRSAQYTQSASIIINYIPNGGADVFGAPCLAWPAAAEAAFTYAASIWETLIHSSVPIVLQACWTDMGASYLGYSAIDKYQRDFTGAPIPNTWYPSSLANALASSDLEPSRPDMHLSYNKAMQDANQWYFGTDGNTPGTQYDFVSVVLHEIAHGLGFAGSMNWDDGIYNPAQGLYQECNGVAGYACWGAGTAYPDSYDRFTEDGSGNDLINTTIYPNPSSALGTALTNNNVWFNGPHANTANGGGRVKLYVPSSWEPGSSYSHLDYATFNGTENSLMVYALSFGASKHSPGPVTIGLLHDIGWPIPMANTPPTLSGLPDLALNPGEARDNAIDLWAYVTDDLDPAAVMTYTITNSPPPTVGVTIDGNRYIDVNPTESFTGTFPVLVEVEDTGGLTDTDTFSITFSEIPNTAPTLSGLPDQELGPNQSKDNAIDLWAYASDAEDLDTDLAFTITNSPPVSAGVSIDGNRYIDINPAAGFVGTVPVDVQVMDTGGLTDTDTFTINFLDTQYVYLPLAMRCYPLVPSLAAISNPDGDGLYTVQWAMPACSTAVPSQYEFQLATDPGFSYVDGDTTTATSVDVYTPDPATYYWRVRAYVNGQWTGWSNVRSVNVGAFSYVFVNNLSGGNLLLEIVNVEKASFPIEFYDYWRSVPVGTYTVRAWMRCGYAQLVDNYFPLYEYVLEVRCPALSMSPEPSIAEIPDVDFVFKGSAAETTVP